ncbi:hypothetical protein G7Y79_00019g047410 [Physcia stellaris]|nr:hypothetical protein G7Y79_00019g047410 [Physcia stellaris]
MSFDRKLPEALENMLRFQPPVVLGSFLLSLACLPAIALATFYFLNYDSRNVQPKGCRKLGLHTQSNLADEHDKRYHAAAQKQTNSTVKANATVKSLWIYPIKSCQGIELEQGSIISTGMEYDRLFCFAQLKSPFPVSLDTPEAEKANHKWEFITQRRFASMALIKTELWVPDPASPTYSSELLEVRSGGVVVIRYPSITRTGFVGMLSNLWVAIGGRGPEKVVQLPLDPTVEQTKSNGYIIEEMKIWKDIPKCLNMGTTIAPNSKLFLEELQVLIGCTNPLALFRITSEHPRKVYRCAPRKETLGWQPQVTFGDAYPLHIMNLASVRDLGTKIKGGPPSLTVRRFRPNIVFTGFEAYEEDAWKRIRIGNYEYHVSCRTVRCLLPNVDPTTGEKHPSEPNRTLKSFRCIDEGDIKNACLGMQMVAARPESEIRVGDAIEVLETGEHYYIRQ